MPRQLCFVIASEVEENEYTRYRGFKDHAKPLGPDGDYLMDQEWKHLADEGLLDRI